MSAGTTSSALAYTFMHKKFFKFSALFLTTALTAPVATAQTPKGVISETEFDLAADALIREVEDPNSGVAFSLLRRNILSLFSALPPVVQQKLRVEKYDERLNQIDGKWYPQVSMNAGIKNYQRDSTTLGNTSPLNVTVQQKLWDFGATTNERVGLEAERDAEQSAIRGARSDTLLKCIQATLALQKARRLEFFVLGYVNSRKSFAKFMEQRKELGAASEIDVVRAKAKVAQALEQIPAARAEVARAMAAYEAVFGQQPQNVSYQYYRLPPVAPLSDDQGLDAIAKASPSVAAQRAVAAAAAARVSQLRMAQLGVFQAQFGVSSGERSIAGYSRQSTLSVEYRVEIFDGFRSQAAVQEAILTSSEEILELDQITRDHIQALRNAKSDMESSKATLVTRLDLLKTTRAVDAGTRELFTLDRASITDVFREQEAHFLAARQVVEGIFARDVATYRYLHVLDKLLPAFELES